MTQKRHSYLQSSGSRGGTLASDTAALPGATGRCTTLASVGPGPGPGNEAPATASASNEEAEVGSFCLSSDSALAGPKAARKGASAALAPPLPHQRLSEETRTSFGYSEWGFQPAEPLHVESLAPVKTALVVPLFAGHQLAPKRRSVPTPNASRHPAELTTVRTMPTVSHSMKTQLGERRAAEFYEFAIPFEVATAPASRESTGIIMNRSDDGRRIGRGPRATTGSVRPLLLHVFAAVTALLVTAADSQSLSCDSAVWKTSSGTLKCSTFGGKPNAIELADGGAWTHAYQELAVVPSVTYRVSGEFYTLAVGECDGAAQVRWCSPSVAVCPGNYTGVSYCTTPASCQRCVAR
jgi:hypothetical protein